MLKKILIGTLAALGALAFIVVASPSAHAFNAQPPNFGVNGPTAVPHCPTLFLQWEHNPST